MDRQLQVSFPCFVGDSSRGVDTGALDPSFFLNSTARSAPHFLDRKTTRMTTSLASSASRLGTLTSSVCSSYSSVTKNEY
jgi:hypothetical protein